jgi:GH25 family lysozyme M1 (1,4-beta-N-acetylmuramidase)
MSSGTNGIDLSHYNHPLDLSKIAGLDFVIAKRTEGTDPALVDTSFDSWAEQARAHNLAFGAYHVFHAQTHNARRQAEWFIEHVKPRSGWSLWVDYEEAGFGPSPADDAEQLGLFNMTIKYHFHAQKTGIYTNGDGLARIRPYLYETNYNALWYATVGQPMMAQSSPPWQVHQYTIVNGIDRDHSVWSREQWDAYTAW